MAKSTLVQGGGVCVTQTAGDNIVMGYGLRAPRPCSHKEQELYSR